ncbi:DHA2 family efflux MFS transporter permease subunit [Pollutimonas sp. H1-120]|uniref:DHA2 family efflux MFS transporter permease subunit n=1 Tax=Pollutimonas sp. H1-120 TaxID=3148824 RepID=UPI003B523EC5
MSEASSSQQHLAQAIAPAIWPLEGMRRLAGTVSVSLATFMSVLDISIANVSLPTIAGDLGASPTQGTWIITSFGVANAIALPLTGWLVLRLGTLRLFLASVTLFTLMSVLCAIAPTLESLVVFRVLQGLFAGPMVPLCQALLLRIYPPQQLGFALSILAMTTLSAPVIGPLLGGWLSDNWSWHWIFLVNVPVGIVSVLVAWRAFRGLETPVRMVRVDSMGLGLLVVWVGSLQFLLDMGRHNDWFASAVIVLLALTALIAFAAFMIWESTERHAIVDLNLFGARNFRIGSLTMAAAYGLFLGNLVLLPLWLQQYMGYSATLAGLVMAPVGLTALLAAPLAGRAVSSSDPRRLVSIAFLIFAFASWLRAQFNTDTDLGSMMIASLVQGAGNALFFVPLMAIVLNRMPSDRIASASGISIGLRYIAGAFGTSLMISAWDWRASVHRNRLVEGIADGTLPWLEYERVLVTAGLTPLQSLAHAERILEQQAHTLAANDLFQFSALCFLLLLAPLWRANWARPAKAASAACGAAAGPHKPPPG